jgi:hypothetical protein
MHKCQEWIPRSWASRAFLIVVVLQAAIDITIQANLLWRFTTAMQIFQDNNEKRYPVYLYIFVTAQ